MTWCAELANWLGATTLRVLILPRTTTDTWPMPTIMSLFVDTSALLAIIDADQERHSEVARVWYELLDRERVLFTSNYVLVETFALVQRRLGLDATRELASVVVPLLQPLWVEEAIHSAAVASLVAAGRRQLSLVDCASFELMRRNGLTEALALDRDFAEQGFNLLPDPSADTDP